MQSYMVGVHHEYREKGDVCPCGHEKDSHSSSVSGDTICYGGGECRCGRSYPSRIRIPTVGTIQEVNLNVKKPQFRPNRVQAKILKVIGGEKVYHRYHGSNAFCLCEVEYNGKKQLAYVEWVDEN